jgi:hypothetical protein
MIGEARSTSFTVAPRLCFFRCRTTAMTGRRRAKRDGNPTATPLGAPVDCKVGPQLPRRDKSVTCDQPSNPVSVDDARAQPLEAPRRECSR